MDASRQEDGAGKEEGDVAMDQSGDAAPKKTESKNLDLAFAMDCTGSMGSYIHQAQKNIRLIVEEIVSKEKADVCLALVEYRDHPPEDQTFVTRVNDFTSSVRSMKQWLDQCSASGGGDTPEAVADALHQVVKLRWREDSTKICVFIADAPPHGLSSSGDHFPNGCPDGLDPMVVTRELAEKGITLYIAGCEPSITAYKDFFMALAHLTGGQYVPLARADVLAKVIVGGAQEELSLQQLMEEVNQEVIHAAAQADEDIDAEDLTRQVHMKLKSRGFKHTNEKISLISILKEAGFCKYHDGGEKQLHCGPGSK
ncbi:hypothetical protein NP493_607g01025 [Ridgeia piscesae]|uniref:VWFA domain-containing protein n=1 Tax=Ridgeia piscesae TaxID=27915 RepID=A0AAD9KU28_RIDPI|nr:hypothetical protein NP493_607g01025 [Ridgeia piscesae]